MCFRSWQFFYIIAFTWRTFFSTAYPHTAIFGPHCGPLSKKVDAHQSSVEKKKRQRLFS
jgi:hypothetical protein